MPSASFTSSRNYVRRSRRKGANRIPLPSRTTSGKRAPASGARFTAHLSLDSLLCLHLLRYPSVNRPTDFTCYRFTNYSSPRYVSVRAARTSRTSPLNLLPTSRRTIFSHTGWPKKRRSDASVTFTEINIRSLLLPQPFFFFLFFQRHRSRCRALHDRQFLLWNVGSKSTPHPTPLFFVIPIY